MPKKWTLIMKRREYVFQDYYNFLEILEQNYENKKK